MPEEFEPTLTETLARIVRLIIRRRWWIIGTSCPIVLATVFILFQLPNRYTSVANLFVVQQQVPERYVVPTTTTDITKTLDAMTQRVLSRTRLLEIIEQLGLYPYEKKRLAPEELISLMRRNVTIKPLESSNSGRADIDAFKISFTANDPDLAQKVTSRLTALFIEENLKTREDQAATTTNFLTEQLAVAKKKLVELEQKVREFKMQYLGELPQQEAGNLALLAGLQAQLQNVGGSLSRAQQQRLYLESLLQEYRHMAANRIAIPGSSGDSQIVDPIELAERDLARLQSERSQLLDLYTPEHPDVLKKQRQIASQTTLIRNLKAAKAALPEKGQAPSNSGKPEESSDNAAVAQLRSQLEANRLEIQDLSATEQKLKTSIDRLESRLNLTPVREQELTSLLRDYELSKLNYADLQNKTLQSQLAASLEKQQEGQQFRLIDHPSHPTVPSSPKRLKISLDSLGVGLLLGLALAVVAEKRDTSFHTEKDLSQSFPAPLVVSLPLLFTASELRMRRWRQSIEWLTASLMVMAVFAAELFVYQHG